MRRGEREREGRGGKEGREQEEAGRERIGRGMGGGEDKREEKEEG